MDKRREYFLEYVRLNKMLKRQNYVRLSLSVGDPSREDTSRLVNAIRKLIAEHQARITNELGPVVLMSMAMEIKDNFHKL